RDCALPRPPGRRPARLHPGRRGGDLHLLKRLRRAREGDVGPAGHGLQASAVLPVIQRGDRAGSLSRAPGPFLRSPDVVRPRRPRGRPYTGAPETMRAVVAADPPRQRSATRLAGSWKTLGWVSASIFALALLPASVP